MDVIVRPHLLSERELVRLDVPPGTTIAEMVDAYPWPPGCTDQVCALINGVAVPPMHWRYVRPKPGTEVMLALHLHGGKKGKTILALVATIVISIYAPGWGTAIAAQMGMGATAGTIIGAGIMAVGALAISAIFKPPPIKPVESAKNEASNTYGFSGQSNPIRPYSPVPRIYGMHRVYPDACAAPYTTQVGADTYLIALYNFGYSPLWLSDFRIGDNSVSNFATPPEIYVHDNFVAGQPLNVYTTDAWQDSLSQKIIAGQEVRVTTQERTDWATIDIAWTKGLGYLNNNGGIDGRLAKTQVWFKTATEGEGSWRPVNWAPWKAPSEGSIENTAQAFIAGNYNGNTGRMELPAGQQTFTVTWGWFLPWAGVMMLIQDVWMTISSATGNSVTFTAGLPKSIAVGVYNKKYQIPVTYYDPSGHTWSVGKATPTPFVASLTISFPWRDRWQLKLHKMDPEQTDGRYLDDRVVSALKSFTNQSPVAPDVGMTIVEVRVKASDQLSGMLNNFNALAMSYLMAWDGAQWVWALTSNPAWEYLDLLRGNGNKKPVPDARIDWDAIMRWAARNDRTDAGFSQPNSRCDFVIDRTYTLWELLCSVAANGRAMPTMKDNKYSVILDEENATPVQVFTPRNCWGLSSTRKYLDTPHAFRVKWIDPGADYKPADAMVYAPNYTSGNATVFEDFDTFGVTRWEQAIRDGRYTLGQALYRQEEFSITTDIENIVCSRGNLVHVAHDVLQVGGWSARIESIAGNTVTFDSPLKTYQAPFGLRFRSDQAVISAPIAATLVDQNVVDVTGGVPATAQVGDLVLYGTIDRIVGEYLVKSIEPGEDFTARITLSERAPNIYAFERGAIPPYVPQPGSIISFTAQPVRNLTALVNSYITDRYPQASVKLQWAPPATVPLPSLYIVSSVNLEDGTVKELGRTTGTSYVPLDDVDTWRPPYKGATLTYEVVPMWPGLPGPATRVTAEMPSDEIVPPAALTTVTAQVLPRAVRVTWDRSIDPLIAYYIVRYGAEASTWEDNAATERKVKADTTDFPANFLVGTHRAFVCQEDLYGARSASISTTFVIELPRAVPLTGNSVANTAFLRWGSLSGVVDGEWSAQTSFQIEYYEVAKAKVVSAYLRGTPAAPYYIPNSIGVIWPSTFEAIEARNLLRATTASTLVGKYAGEFAVSDEQQPGDWQYCVRGVDFAGNKGPPACITLAIEAPDNYFLLDEIDNLLPEPETTEAGVVQAGATPFEWLGPIKTAETWAQHFETRSWDQIQDQIDAGFPVYAQPADVTPALVAWEFDYVNPLPSLMVTAESTYTVVAPTPILRMRLKSKVNAGDAWTLVQEQPDMVSSLLPVNSRWVRVEAEIATDAAQHGLLVLSNIAYRIDVKYKDDSGIVETGSDAQEVVVFNIPFVDVRGVSLTSLDANVAFARAEIAFDQRSMTVYSFGPTGLPVGGTVSWIARGV
jgi:Putative phage tail protein